MSTEVTWSLVFSKPHSLCGVSTYWLSGLNEGDSSPPIFSWVWQFIPLPLLLFRPDPVAILQENAMSFPYLISIVEGLM